MPFECGIVRHEGVQPGSRSQLRAIMVKARAEVPEHGQEGRLSGIKWSLVGDGQSVLLW